MSALAVFGGVCGNLQALDAFLEWIARRGLGAANVVCAGDLAAYCADGAAVCARVRDELPGAVLIRGNCERALAEDADDCGCGFSPGSACAALSGAWFSHARTTIDSETKRWLGSLPPRADFVFGGKKIVATHAGANGDNEFIFPSTSPREKARQLEALDADGIICGHSGIPFSEFIGGVGGVGGAGNNAGSDGDANVGGAGGVGVVGSRLWHNSGALGMPANDGTDRVWFSLWEEEGAGIRIRHIPLPYDIAGAQNAMRLAGLPRGYCETLSSGIWPSDEILPPPEKSQQGKPLSPPESFWESVP